MQSIEYEEQQRQLIKTWKNKRPSVISKSLDIALSPATRLVKKVIPIAAIQGVLDFSSMAAEWLTDTIDITRDGNVKNIEELKSKDLALSDGLANGVHNWAIGIATIEGGVTGGAGLPGLVVDIPAIVTLALRTIHKIGVCYGYEVTSKEDREFILGVMAASGSNDMSEKIKALATLRSIEVNLSKQACKSLATKTTQDRMSHDAAIIGIKSLAKQLGLNLTQRKTLQAIPAVGAFVGASVNGWYIKEVGWAARRSLQERWLIDNGKPFSE